MTESLNDLLAALHAERVRTWDPQALQVNVRQRRTLVETADRAAWVKAGDQAPDVRLTEVDGEELTLQGLTAKGPVVLILFRFATCPACNIALPYYDRNLWPTLSSLGIPLVAISPQVPEALINVRQRHGFGFRVASDPGARLGRRFGLTFKSESEPTPTAVAQGLAEMTHPTVVVIDADHRVRFVEVTPDWMARTEAEPVVEAVRKVLEERLEPVGA